MAKQKKMKLNLNKIKLTHDESSLLMFGVGLIAGVGSTVLAVNQSFEYSFLTVLAALVVLRMINKNS